MCKTAEKYNGLKKSCNTHLGRIMLLFLLSLATGKKDHSRLSRGPQVRWAGFGDKTSQQSPLGTLRALGRGV